MSLRSPALLASLYFSYCLMTACNYTLPKALKPLQALLVSFSFTFLFCSSLSLLKHSPFVYYAYFAYFHFLFLSLYHFRFHIFTKTFFETFSFFFSDKFLKKCLNSFSISSFSLSYTLFYSHYPFSSALLCPSLFSFSSSLPLCYFFPSTSLLP